MRVLLVEDNEDNRFLFQIFLKKIPIHLDTAENGSIATQKVFKKGYDLVFMDIQMPIMDGLTATAKIREWEKSKGIQKEHRVRIVALTANTTKEDVTRSYECGCDEYLSKPIKKDTLLEAVLRSAQEKAEKEQVLQQKLDSLKAGHQKRDSKNLCQRAIA